MKNNTIQFHTLQLLSAALWGREAPDIPTDICGQILPELERHSVAAIPVAFMQKLNLDGESRTIWDDYCCKIMAHSILIAEVQKEVLNAFLSEKIGVVVLKGTAAACYYPAHVVRTMGDIDLLVKPDDFDNGCALLKKLKFKEITTESEERRGRHRSFKKSKIVVELHRSFALISDDKIASQFDALLFSDIEIGRTLLSSSYNGLVLIEHIAQHLKGGIGLRQIMDWMLFVNYYVDDKVWNDSFRQICKSVGMEQLALITTRMCQLYLGLREDNITWCLQADKATCDQFMQYVFESGNFGHKRGIDKSNAIVEIPSVKHPIKLMRYIQEHGEKNWKLLKRYPCFKPFAWIYQCCRYIRMIVTEKVDCQKIKASYIERQNRKELFDKLGL